MGDFQILTFYFNIPWAEHMPIPWFAICPGNRNFGETLQDLDMVHP